MEQFTVNLPAYWACGLINDDTSGLSGIEENELNQWYINNVSGCYCAGVSEETFFGQFNGLGCDLAEYTFIKH